jgi:tRNA nucleotidyltransferase (CCA-adding enzyme)
MAEIVDLFREIKKQLPAELVEFMQKAGEVAARQGQSLYLVGGVVRDLFLRRTNLDLDLVVDGDAIKLAQQLAGIIPARITTHSRFNTAKLRWDRWSVDLATVRSETYERPGALPRVKSGTLTTDLFRRDFTINAMAIELTASRYGQLVDLYGGRDDLEHRLIRILHKKSFVDDATRIWRALRYEQRLDFQLEANTRRRLKRDMPMLDTISGDRIRHELELVLKEELPEKALHRADELGVLTRLHSALRGDGWLAEKFQRARRLYYPESPPVGLYLALFCYRLTEDESEKLIAYLRPAKLLTQTIRDTLDLRAGLEVLATPGLPRSSLYFLLEGSSPIAITANQLATDSPIAHRRLKLFLNRLRYIKPALTGDDLRKMGIPPGPRMKKVLHRLHTARLDGKVRTRKGEVEMVRKERGSKGVRLKTNNTGCPISQYPRRGT